MSMALPPNCCRTDNHAEIRKIEIEWDDGLSTGFHYVWLLHNARCCYGMSNDTSVKIDLLPDDPQLLVISKLETKGDLLIIHWDDELVTEHHLPTLHSMAYDVNSRRKHKHQPLLWDAQSAIDIPSFKFEELGNEETRLRLLLAVNDYGIARVRQVPVIEGSITSIADHFGPIHVNNYGRVFDVRTQTNVNLGSNTGASLGPHTDEGYRHAPPGISFFHCLIASQQGGGESTLVDGFRVAQELKINDPVSFEVLTKIPVLHQRLAPPDEDMQAHGRVIVTDIDNEVIGIRFTDRTIPPQDIPDEWVESFYKALNKFRHIVNSDRLMFCYLMQPGDLHVFDNHRILHGRTGFDASANRHLQQCSVNRDEFHNRLRVLAAEQGHPIQFLSLSGGAMG